MNTPRRVLTALRFSVSFLLIAQVAFAQPTASVRESEVIEKLRRVIAREVAVRDLPAFSIAVVDRDRVVWKAGFGFRDAARQQPASAATVYRVGSVSKLFTDIAVMQLVDQGRLDLDAPVARYLRSFRPENPFGVAITLRHLMSHQSGLVREPPVGHYFDPDEPTLEATVASLNQTKLVYRPGSRTKYSNAGVSVVGAVLARVKGKPFTECLRETVLAPLQTSHSDFALTPELRPDFATGWMWTYDGRRFAAPGFELGTTPAGSLYASVEDLSRLLMTIFADGRTPSGGKLLEPKTLATMLAPQPDASGKPLSFGLGFHIGSLDGHRKVGHGGAIYGFSTQLEALPDQQLGAVAVCSLDGSNGLVGRIADYALRLMLAARTDGPLPEFETTGPIPPPRARSLRGSYQSDSGTAEVTELGGRVFLNQGTYRHELRALASGEIVVDDVIGFGTAVSITDDGELTVGSTRYSRLPDEPPPVVSKSWRGLIGEYGWDHNTLYILENRGQLYALIEWFYAYPLKEIEPDLFAFPDYGLYHGETLQFHRDGDGIGREVVAAEVRFKRREVGTRDGETFRIQPVRPIAELREIAMAAQPPAESGDFRDSDLADLSRVEPGIRLDVRYASTNNFTGAVFYRQPRAFLQRPAAEAVARVHRGLSERGLGLMIHDAYRPWHVTKMFWDATPEEMKDFVADPQKGSRHNRGCAVDLTLFDRSTGDPIQMVAGYDEFSARSFPLYPGGTSRQRWYRDLLRRVMEDEGFTVYEFEWWHFDYRDWQKYRIGNRTFEAIDDGR